MSEALSLIVKETWMYSFQLCFPAAVLWKWVVSLHRQEETLGKPADTNTNPHKHTLTKLREEG